MKGVLIAVALVGTLGTASAGPNSFAGVSFPSAGSSAPRGTLARTATIDSRSGAAIPAVTTLHPVVGSVQRKSHFTNPFTHKAKYTNTVYNPVLGQFGTNKFRR